MDLLMEKLRSKASQYKTFSECAKAIRMSQLEKRFSMDNADRGQLQKCLDTLLQSMQVNSLQGMVERLESISRQLSLKLMAGQTGLELFISSDMFYLEVSLEPNGGVKDVKIHHDSKPEQQSCEQLVKALQKGDFDDFTVQLEGFISIYQLNAEKKVKCKAFSALCALEADLVSLWSINSGIKDIPTLLNVSSVGILEKRRGGHPLKLTYFLSPYDILGFKEELTVDAVRQNNIGCSVTVSIEGAAAHKLQIVPIVSINRNSGKSLATYAPLHQNNSFTLPAYFTLKFNKPQPVCVNLLQQIAKITELEMPDVSSASPIFSLITRHISGGKLNSLQNQGLFVTLPEQTHCYFLTECKGLNGLVTSSIPFTHPAQVPKILSLLRQQSLFNTLVASVVRNSDKQDYENMIIFEITALSWQHLSVTFEHPLEESMATMEIDLTDFPNLAINLYSAESIDSSYLATVLNRCLSIPVTMRSAIKKLEKLNELQYSMNGGFSSGTANGNVDNGMNDNLEPPNESNDDYSSGPIDPSKIKQEPGLNSGNSDAPFDELTSNLTTTATDLVLKRKHKSKDEYEIVVETSSSDSESEEVKQVKKVKSLLEAKNLTSPSVTITPITNTFNQMLPAIGLERRPGIEIIPINTAPPANLPSSITITPITSDKDLKKRSLDDREKKRKRKREEEAKMGPPEKVPMKSDPLSKPVSVSIKPTTDSPPSGSRPNSPSMRKFSTSPIQFRDKLPSVAKSNPSPKHSPSYSPKHSPKHGSPKPSSSASSGKPSMSTLKSASGSPTPKTGEIKKNLVKDATRDKERRPSCSGSPKIKSSSVKLKQLEVTSPEISLTALEPCVDPKSASGSPVQKNRKGSLSAVIDKLKSAQEVVDTLPKDKITITPTPVLSKNDGRITPSGIKIPEGVKNPAEYMVKSSQDGIKITINKTRTKDGAKSGKLHTGLKPGVTSGPASKKPLSSSPKPTSSLLKSNSSSTASKVPGLKPISKGLSRPSIALKPGDPTKKDPLKPRPLKPDKPGLFKDNPRKGSPTGLREEDVMKVIKADPVLPTSLVKPFDTKFQIPKLSARSNPTTSAESPSTSSTEGDLSNNNTITKGDKPEPKVIEVSSLGKNNLDLAALKYQTSKEVPKTPTSTIANVSLPITLPIVSPKLPITSPNLPTTSMSSITSKSEDVPPLQTDLRMDAVIEQEEVKPPTEPEAKGKEILLDFSTNQGLQAKLAIMDQSGSSQSPQTMIPTTATTEPSPIVITDDDLMDEAIMLRK